MPVEPTTAELVVMFGMFLPLTLAALIEVFLPEAETGDPEAKSRGERELEDEL